MKAEILIPESLEDITLEQYQKFIAIENPTNEDLLSIFLNITIEDINKIKASEFDRLVVYINSLFKVEQKYILKFNLKGIEFGFIPDLDNISYGENKDITTYINDWSKMNRAMAVLYRPIKQKQKGKYLIEDYEGSAKYSELMKDMPLSIVFGAKVFFYNLTKELLNCIPSYLEKVAKQEQMKGLISEENGEAIRKLTHSLKKDLEELLALNQMGRNTIQFQNTHYMDV